MECLIEEGDRPAMSVIAGWLHQLVKTLRYLHSHPAGVMHKDVKPANIMTSDKRAILIDFNISRQDDFFWGTPDHKCPLVDSAREWMPYADIWALAASFYELLVGRMLFEDQTSFKIEIPDDCPAGFPEATFSALKAIIRVCGQGSTPAEYEALFQLDTLADKPNRLPHELIDKYGLTSRRQQTLVLAVLNLPRIDQPRSKDVTIQSYFRDQNMSLPGDEKRRYRATFSQLKSQGVVVYAGVRQAKAVLTPAFLQDYREFHEILVEA